MFRHQKLIKDIDKLKIPEEEIFFVYVGLTGLGMYVTMKALEIALNRLGYDAEITLTIYNRIIAGTQEALINNLIERWGNPEIIEVVHDDIILPLLDRIPEYFQEQIDWQESGANDLPPHKWGVFSIVLYQALGNERTAIQ